MIPQKQRITLIAGIVLALIAMFMVKVYLDQQSTALKEQAKREIIERQERLASILVARQDIPKGTTINPDIIDTKIVPREYIQPQAVSSPERVIGMMAAVQVSQGEQITLNKLITPQQARGWGSLAMMTPVGKRAITISVDNIASLMGMVRPGDYVDVIGLIPVPVQGPDEKQTVQAVVMPLFQNVQVLAVGQDVGREVAVEARYNREEQRAETSPVITLALSPQEASLIAFIQEQGKIRLTLRSPADSRIEPIQPASWETFFQYIMPQAKEPGKESEMIVAPERQLEIYRGLKKETLPVSR